MRYFSPEGDPALFACQCGECDWTGPKGELLLKLEEARSLAGIPFVINSGPRCPRNNLDVGGVDDSEHVHGSGADIRCDSSWARMKIVRACLAAGFDRIGVAKTFVHVGVSKSKPRPMMWVY